jgi:exodeoxyribonuclease VII large subunit
MQAPTLAAPPTTVSDLIRSVRSTLREAFGVIRVAGEVSNFRQPASGHCYFTLKDSEAQLRCVLFRSHAARLSFALRDGMQIVVGGQVDVYEPRGDLQLRVVSVQSAGEGALQKAFEQLKQRLKAEGLFEPVHKKPLPGFPQRIGIVTSRTGAALHDIVSIIERRYPVVHVVLVPVAVQGIEAAGQISDAIRCLNELAADSPNRPDVLIVGRGGGSAEDLWSFNEEAIARAIFASEIPVVSAVGHETDFSIADFVADIRAATPSMAAEIVVPDQRSLIRGMKSSLSRAEMYVRALISTDRRRLHHALQSRGFAAPRQRLEQLYQRADDLIDRMTVLQQHRLSTTVSRVNALIRQMDALNPRRVLERGFIRVERDGTAITRGSQLGRGDEVRLHFADTSREAQITS